MWLNMLSNVDLNLTSISLISYYDYYLPSVCDISICSGPQYMNLVGFVEYCERFDHPLRKIKERSEHYSIEKLYLLFSS